MRPRWRSAGRRRATPHRLRPQRSGGWRRRDFVVSRGMTAQPAGEESRDQPLWLRRSRRSRPSARSGHWRGRLVRSIYGQTTETMAALRNARTARTRSPASCPRPLPGNAMSTALTPARMPQQHVQSHAPIRRRQRLAPPWLHLGVRLDDPRTAGRQIPCPTRGGRFQPLFWFAWATSCQTRARSRPAGPSAAMPAMRMKAVMPIAIAPMTENTICQVSDGMRCLTMPWVA